MKNKTLIFLIVVFILVLIGAYFLYGILVATTEHDNLAVEETSQAAEVSEETAETELEVAPDFTVTDKNGNEVNLSDFYGKPIIVNFWASWCGPCKSEMPDFQELYVEYGNEINFLFVNVTDGSRETVETASKFIAEAGYTFPVYYDTVNQNAAMTYGTYSIPMTIFFDAEGHGIAQGTGAMDKDTILKGINMILPE